MKLFICKNKYFDCILKKGNWYNDEKTYCTGNIDDVYKCIYLLVPAMEI